MHFYHSYLVSAKDSDEAKLKVEELLESYGEGQVYDYYNIEQRSFDGTPHKITTKNSDKVWKHVQSKIQCMREELQSLWDGLFSVMEKGAITELSAIGINGEGLPFGCDMIGYYLKQIGVFISGYYTENSYFYYVDEYCASIDKETFIKAVNEGAYIVEVNLHN